MNVDAIITYLSNFQDTWNGWNDLINGITDFFGANPVEKLKDFFDADTFAGLSSEPSDD